MKRYWVYALVALIAGSATSCRTSGGGTRKSAVIQETSAPPPAVRPGEVMGPDDMERLRRERAELIDRPSPLGEEQDAVAALAAAHPR
jgi:hypothetical protein